MEGIFSNLPAWGLLVLGVVWLAFQFVRQFLERQEQKREAEVRKQYRESRGSSVVPGPDRPLGSEDTGRHDLRRVIDEERERDQRLEILATSKASAEVLNRLASAEENQTRLLASLAAGNEQHGKLLEQLIALHRELADNQRSIIRYLVDDRAERLGKPRPAPGGTLRELPAAKGRTEG